MASDEEEIEEGQETTRHVQLSDEEKCSTPITEQPVVPPPPPTTGEDTCIVGILLPDGRRLQRRFYKHDTVEVGIRTDVVCLTRSMASGSLCFLQLGDRRGEIEALQIETAHSRSSTISLFLFYTTCICLFVRQVYSFSNV